MLAFVLLGLHFFTLCFRLTSSSFIYLSESLSISSKHFFLLVKMLIGYSNVRRNVTTQSPPSPPKILERVTNARTCMVLFRRIIEHAQLHKIRGNMRLPQSLEFKLFQNVATTATKRKRNLIKLTSWLQMGHGLESTISVIGSWFPKLRPVRLTQPF